MRNSSCAEEELVCVAMNHQRTYTEEEKRKQAAIKASVITSPGSKTYSQGQLLKLWFLYTMLKDLPGTIPGMVPVSIETAIVPRPPLLACTITSAYKTDPQILLHLEQGLYPLKMKKMKYLCAQY